MANCLNVGCGLKLNSLTNALESDNRADGSILCIASGANKGQDVKFAFEQRSALPTGMTAFSGAGNESPLRRTNAGELFSLPLPTLREIVSQGATDTINALLSPGASYNYGITPVVTLFNPSYTRSMMAIAKLETSCEFQLIPSSSVAAGLSISSVLVVNGSPLSIANIKEAITTNLTANPQSLTQIKWTHAQYWTYVTPRTSITFQAYSSWNPQSGNTPPFAFSSVSRLTAFGIIADRVS